MHTRRIPLFVALLAALQMLSTTYGLRVPVLSPLCPFLFLGGGLATAVLLLKAPAVALPRRRPAPTVLFVSVGVLITAGYFIGGRIIRSSPLTVEQADMLPIIEVMCRRAVAGELRAVYEPIPQIWNGVQPIYPPAMWASFLPAVALGFDLRWMTLAGIVLAAAFCLYPVLQAEGRRYHQPLILIGALALLLTWLYTADWHNVIRLTEEGVVYFWYCLLVYAVVTGNGWAIGVATALCLLTRYSIVGWLPAVVLWWLLNGEGKTAWRATVAGGAAVAFLLILPFGWKPVRVLASLPGGYVGHAQKVWDEFSQHFYHSPGMARFFGREGAAALHGTLIVVSFALPVVFAGYVLRKQRKTPVRNVPLALLVLTLSVFYAFVDVPYLYLYYTPVFVNLAVAGLITGQRVAAGKSA